jgi:hypothetical protein
MPETSEPGGEEDGILSNEISNAVVALYKEHGGKGRPGAAHIWSQTSRSSSWAGATA